MGDEVDRRLDAAVNEAFDEYFENTYNSIVENRTDKKKKRAYVERNREAGHNRLWNDYFSENPSFPENLFRRRFRMNRQVFMRIINTLSANVPFFQQRRLDDINVLDRSPVFDDIYEGRAPRVTYMVNGHQYDLAYYLTDGIYPKWSTFIQSITLPQGPKAELFAKVQEATRKDVERAFGVLQARFAIVKNPALSLDKGKIGNIMRACIILHNMIVENERGGYTLYDTSEFEEGESSRSSHVEHINNMPTHFGNMLGLRNHVRDRRTHQALKNDLIENIWNKFGDED